MTPFLKIRGARIGLALLLVAVILAAIAWNIGGGPVLGSVATFVGLIGLAFLNGALCKRVGITFEDPPRPYLWAPDLSAK